MLENNYNICWYGAQQPGTTTLLLYGCEFGGKLFRIPRRNNQNVHDHKTYPFSLSKVILFGIYTSGVIFVVQNISQNEKQTSQNKVKRKIESQKKVENIATLLNLES